ncbi:MAG: AEC family transporter [Alphaproteobacteria bacterium]|jgi:predicted permease|nr:AEC family transporter [Alphaproteobacteria bacterium]
MSAVVNVALPVFAIILAGVLAGRAGVLGRAASEALNAFVYWIALPPLLFLAMARAPVAETLHPNFIGAFLGGILAIWLLGSLIGRLLYGAPLAEAVMQGMSASFSNTGYMGIPLFLAAFGERGLAPAGLATVIMSLVAVGLAVTILETGARRGGGALRAAAGAGRALARNPLVVAPLAGLGWSLAALPLPVPLVTFAELIGAAAGPCALFAIGLFLAGRSPGGETASVDWIEAAWISVLKLVWQPVITGLLIVTLFPMEPFWALSAIILAALPTGALTFVVAQRYAVYVERASAVILVSTVLSVVTVSLLLALAGPQPPAP